MASPLDNPVWHALSGPLARFSESAGQGEGGRFLPEVSVFAGAEEIEPGTWEAHAKLAGPGGAVIFFRDRVPVPPEGWAELFRIPTLQMVAGDLPPVPPISAIELSEKDVPEMLDLTQLTEPGPFLARTHELGRYLGVRPQGQLLAMAGERFRVAGWTEISAVCTHPSAQRRGLGSALTLAVASQIRARGEEAFLHVVESNENAVRLYQSIGFTLRSTMEVVGAIKEAATLFAEGRSVKGSVGS